jgi:hypothetical protein
MTLQKLILEKGRIIYYRPSRLGGQTICRANRSLGRNVVFMCDLKFLFKSLVRCADRSTEGRGLSIVDL